jgi:hypothetical protein
MRVKSRLGTFEAGNYKAFSKNRHVSMLQAGSGRNPMRS